MKTIGIGADMACAQLDYRLADDNPVFNLIAGTFGTPDPTIKYSFYDLGYDVPEPLYSFGVKRVGSAPSATEFLIGAEAELDGDPNFHLLAIKEKGVVMKVCDDWPDARGMGSVQFSDYSSSLACAPSVSNNNGGGVGLS